MTKNVLYALCSLTFLSLALYAPSAFGEEILQKKTTTTTTTTSTQSSGTVSEFGPDSIVIRSAPTASPTTYEYTETTTYVDESGNPVDAETVIKSGVPVTVFFNKSGDKMVATKVVVKKTTTTMPRG